MSAAGGAGASAANTCEGLSNNSKALDGLRPVLDVFLKSDLATATLKVDITVQKGPGCRTEAKYTTKFEVRKGNLHPNISNESYMYLEILNKCIGVTLYKNGLIHTGIEADDVCFDPPLKSNAAGLENRITRTDILQVLKTKLVLAHPYYQPKTHPLTLKDFASINSILVTPYRLMRGQLPFYQKYGYFNAHVPALQKLIASAKVSDVVSINVKGVILGGVQQDTTYGTILNTLVRRSLAPDKSLSAVMREINLDTDKAVFPEERESLSSALLDALIDTYGEGAGIDPIAVEYRKYTFDPTSPEWNYWKRRIVISEFRLIIGEKRTGGRRKGRVQRRKSRKQRRQGRGKTKRV